MTYKIIDLFCGAGGMTLGFVDQRYCGGFKPVLAIDNDPASIATHSTNFNGEVVCGNIEAWLEGKPLIPRADVVIGGPPCQGFSLLNKKRDGDERRALWEPYLDVVKLSDAKLFVMENVTELFRSAELNQIVRRAKRMGFKTRAIILNAADYGAPQTRKRTIVIGWRDATIGLLNWPPPQTHVAPDQGGNLPKWRTVREAIGDLGKPVGTEIGHDSPLDLHFGRRGIELYLRVGTDSTCREMHESSLQLVGLGKHPGAQIFLVDSGGIGRPSLFAPSFSSRKRGDTSIPQSIGR
jgi:DNA (cytosine-5)-methyltransferase 1